MLSLLLKGLQNVKSEPFFIVSWAIYTLSYSQDHREFLLLAAGQDSFPFPGLCISRVSWAVPVCLACPQRSRFWDNSCWSFLCTLSSVCVFYPVAIKCKRCPREKLLLAPVDAPSCGDVRVSQDFSTVAWALLFSAECLWQIIHTGTEIAVAHVGKGNICEYPLKVNRQTERVLHGEDAYCNVQWKNKHV